MAFGLATSSSSSSLASSSWSKKRRAAGGASGAATSSWKRLSSSRRVRHVHAAFLTVVAFVAGRLSVNNGNQHQHHHQPPPPPSSWAAGMSPPQGDNRMLQASAAADSMENRMAAPQQQQQQQQSNTNKNKNDDRGHPTTTDLLPHLPDCDKAQSPLSLAELALKYKPTKFVGYAHANYQRLYPSYLEPYRRKRFRLLEIGLDTGAGSLLWQEYFPCATLYGLEHDARRTQTAGAASIATVRGDQGDRDFLQGEFLRQTRGGGGNGKYNYFDVIIDDGGHHYEQQVTSYTVLFDKALAPGGLYLIEDVETSYWKAGTDLYGKPVSRGGQSEPATVVNKFKRLVDVVNKKFFDNTYTVFGPVDFWVATVGFMSNLIILTKKDASHCYSELQYMWPDKLADDCPARTQPVNVVDSSSSSSPLVAYCGRQIINRDDGPKGKLIKREWGAAAAGVAK